MKPFLYNVITILLSVDGLLSPDSDASVAWRTIFSKRSFVGFLLFLGGPSIANPDPPL